MKRADPILALILIAVAGYVLYTTASFPEPFVPGAPGPALFPALLAVVLILLSIALFVQGLFGRDQPSFASAKGVVRSGVAFLLILGFLLLAPWWDSYLLLAALLGSMMALMGERRVPILLAVPLGFDLFLYLVFARVFGVELPSVYF